MGRSHKYQKAKRAERALAKKKQDELLTKEQTVINKMRAAYARYGKQGGNDAE